MTKLKLKTIIIILCCLAALGLAVALLLLFLLPKKAADPYSLLSKADTLTKQNLCLTAILQKNPDDEESRQQLLINYQKLGADLLTIEGTKNGLDIELPSNVSVQPEEPGKLCGTGGIIQKGVRFTDYKNANALATDGETIYLATQTGIIADYHGLQALLTPAKAERMIAAENGLYYLNATARRVQYIARDGHKTKTLAEIAAADFAYLDGVLWIAGTDGSLYKDGIAVETPAPVAELCVANGVLFGAGSEGLLKLEEEVTVVLPSPVCGIVGGDSGEIYYINKNGYPAKFDPALNEAVILKEKPAFAIGYNNGHAYYLNEKLKIKKIAA